MVCRKCGARYLQRIPRVGFFHEKVLPRLGLYPWRCEFCDYKGLYRQRGAILPERSAGPTRIR